MHFNNDFIVYGFFFHFLKQACIVYGFLFCVDIYLFWVEELFFNCFCLFQFALWIQAHDLFDHLIYSWNGPIFTQLRFFLFFYFFFHLFWLPKSDSAGLNLSISFFGNCLCTQLLQLWFKRRNRITCFIPQLRRKRRHRITRSILEFFLHWLLLAFALWWFFYFLNYFNWFLTLLLSDNWKGSFTDLHTLLMHWFVYLWLTFLHHQGSCRSFSI